MNYYKCNKKKQMTNSTNLRYQVYDLDDKGNLSSPITKPISTKERCYKYFNECLQWALVSIDEHGSIIEIIDKNLTSIKKNGNFNIKK